MSELLAACTIVSKNYFAYAKTLAQSYLRHHPNNKFFILVVDEATEREFFACEGVEVFFLEDIHIKDWRKIAFKFEIMELNTNVKPSFLKFILDSGIAKALYLDPDIFVYGPLNLIYDELEPHNIVLTPHSLQPIADDKRPVDRDFLKCGVYNLGFIGVSTSVESRRFLDWWEQRCLAEGFNEVSMGWFVDQKWIDLVPSYFEDVKILKHPGCNVAYWNLHERQAVGMEDGKYVVNRSYDLCFFHFSGIDVYASDSISRHQNRFDLNQRPDLRPLFVEYRIKLLENGYEQYRKQHYAFSTFKNGEGVSLLLRRAYASLEKLQMDDNPFEAATECYRFAKKYKLTTRRDKKAAELGAINSMSLDLEDRRLQFVATVMKLILCIFGVEKLKTLSKFMRYFGVTNNQAALLFSRFRIR